MFPLDPFVRDGRCTIKLSPGILEAWQLVVDGMRAVPAGLHREFSFFDRTDGFLPLGTEYSADATQPDLCDRFCYWPARQAEHKKHPFAAHPFYSTVQRFEAAMNREAESINNDLRAHFGGEPSPELRHDSYVQVCAYVDTPMRAGREFLQDPHEDGHLFTILKPTGPGLVVLNEGPAMPVVLEHDEAMVLAGSLLTALTDGSVPATLHAVKTAPAEKSRVSVMYFANPNVLRDATSWRRKLPIDMAALMQTRHTAFGNSPLKFAHDETHGAGRDPKRTAHNM